MAFYSGKKIFLYILSVLIGKNGTSFSTVTLSFGALFSEAEAIWDAAGDFNAAGWAGLSSWELFDHVTLRAGSLVVAAIISP